jgi:hypothetical protein
MNCDQSRLNVSSLGYSYALPPNIIYDSDEALEYLPGKMKFKVTEMEVYQVIRTIPDDSNLVDMPPIYSNYDYTLGLE